MEPVHTLELNDQELAAMNDIVRKHQLNITAEDLVLVMMGKRTTPVVGLTIKVGQLFEKRAVELNDAANAAAAQKQAEIAAEAEITPLVTKS